MKNKFLFVVVCMFLLIGALAPIVSAQDKLQMWRNSSSGVTPQAYSEIFLEKIFTMGNNNGNWFMLGDLNITGSVGVGNLGGIC
jgi:hypothetical protein